MPKIPKGLKDLDFPDANGTTDTSPTTYIKYVRIDRKQNTAPPLERLGNSGSYVLRATRVAKLPAKGSALADTGIQINIPKGYRGRITEFNRMAYRNEITVGGGVIDNSYNEEIKVVLLNHSTRNRTISPGNPVGLLVIEKIPDVQLVEVKSMKASIGSNKISTELAELDSMTG